MFEVSGTRDDSGHKGVTTRAAKGYRAQTPGIGPHRDHQEHSGESWRAEKGKSSSRTVVAVLRRHFVGQADGGCPTCVSFAQSHVRASMLEGEDRHVIRFGGSLWPGQAGRRGTGRRAGISRGDVCFPRQRGCRRFRARHVRQTAERGWTLHVGGSRRRPVDR